MAEQVTFARYGLLMEGQPLEGEVRGEGSDRPGYFWGTLFEARQRLPLPNGAYHYPVAVLAPARSKIRCEVCTRSVPSAEEFWQGLFKPELFRPHASPEQSLMNLAHAKVFTDGGGAMDSPVFVLNPLFYVFWRSTFAMELREIEPDGPGFVSWRAVPAWHPRVEPGTPPPSRSASDCSNDSGASSASPQVTP
ncbi:MAG: hypothetical protein HY900_17835 [Deltaproteobacteria bacterium]|nr:hypothetical protein [Deltaproteobacteria bacterium]